MMDVYSDPMAMSNQKHVTCSYLGTEKNGLFIFDATFFTTNDFKFLIEYPFNLSFSMMDVYSHPVLMFSQKRVMRRYIDTEKMDFLFLMSHISLETTSAVT